MHLAHELGLLHRAERDLAAALRDVARAHAAEADVRHLGPVLAQQCDAHVARLAPFVQRYGEEAVDEPDRLYAELFAGPREGGLALLRDLQDLYLLAALCDVTWTLVGQAAQGARDRELLDVVSGCEGESAQQMQWLRSRMKQAAPQALVVA
jgi:hypothetical protein